MWRRHKRSGWVPTGTAEVPEGYFSDQGLPVSRRKEIIKIRAEINEIVSKKMTQKINESNSWYFEKINKIDKIDSSRKERERTQISKIRNERGKITDIKEIQRII